MIVYKSIKARLPDRERQMLLTPASPLRDKAGNGATPSANGTDVAKWKPSQPITVLFSSKSKKQASAGRRYLNGG